MLNSEKSNEVYLLLIFIITLNFTIIAYWYFILKGKRLIYTSVNTQKFALFANSLIVIIAIYILSNYKITNVMILALLYYYILKKLVEIAIVLLNFNKHFISSARQTIEYMYLDVAQWTTRLFAFVELYILYFIFFTDK
jgi:hypothetical protein